MQCWLSLSSFVHVHRTYTRVWELYTQCEKWVESKRRKKVWRSLSHPMLSSNACHTHIPCLCVCVNSTRFTIVIHSCAKCEKGRKHTEHTLHMSFHIATLFSLFLNDYHPLEDHVCWWWIKHPSTLFLSLFSSVCVCVYVYVDINVSVCWASFCSRVSFHLNIVLVHITCRVASVCMCVCYIIILLHRK